MPPEMTTFFLIRHGHTAAIGEWLAGTAANMPLNDAGRAQVGRLAAQFRGITLAAVLSSPLERARQTADAIAEGRELGVRLLPALSEFEVGDWTGRKFAALDQDQEWRRFNGARSIVRAPRGELMLEVQQRMVTALIDLSAEYPGAAVAVVSHGDVIRAALMFFLGIPLDFVHRLEISPASISIVTLDGWTPTVQQVNGDSVRAST
jgi:broad specificity phosphatase PhoE